VAGLRQPRPAPRFSRTDPPTPAAAPANGEHTRAVLAGLGYDGDRIEALLASGALGEPAGSPATT
jgi:alpha-methylacyl-CoA racemase